MSRFFKKTNIPLPGTDNSGTADSWGVRNMGKTWQLKFFRSLISFGGRRPAYHIMYLVVLWYVLAVPEVRRRTWPYLNRRFPERRGRWRNLLDSYRLVCNFGISMIDRFAFSLADNRSLRAECVNFAELQRILRTNRGAVLINAHVGCWQMAMSILNKVDNPTSVVMIPPDADQPGSEGMGDDMPFRIIDPRKGFESILAMMQSLRRGEILGLMGDRVFGSQESTVETSFLGDPIHLPFAPYRLAAAAGVPIIVLFSYKTGFRDYAIKLARVIEVDSDQSRNPQSCASCARQFAEALEEFVEKHPWQFFNFYDLWN